MAERLEPREDCGVRSLPTHGSPGRNEASLQISPLAAVEGSTGLEQEQSVSDTVLCALEEASGGVAVETAPTEKQDIIKT